MIGEGFLIWAGIAASLFNTILLCWLGLTVLLNAERRTWGIWLAGGGLLMGAAFFISHAALLAYGFSVVNWEVNFWWQVAWVPVIVLPFAWYVVMLWYAGFWDDRQTPLHRRQRPWLLGILLLTPGMLGVLLWVNLFPLYGVLIHQLAAGVLPIGNIPLRVLAYPAYILLCIILSLDALRRPGPTGRVMGDQARRLARPWLVATSAVLLLVSLLVTGVLLWIVLNTSTLYIVYSDMSLVIAASDVVICLLIAVAVGLLGQAIVSYEIFTGKALPRRGLARHWHSAVLVAGGYSLVVAATATLPIRPIYSLLLATVLMTLFYALFSWRSYAERERYMDQLRPFVASQRLYESLLTRATPPAIDAATPFHALCADVLGARRAYLVPLGPLSSLAGPMLAYPPGADATLPAAGGLAAQFTSPDTMYAPVDPALYGGALWAVPLWSERGLIGVLLLGEKSAGGVYTQEEIEIARASGERLIDTQASAEIAGRLMVLQRRRLAESQVLDRRARRALHDDVLPRLHTAILNLSSGPTAGDTLPDTLRLLADVHRQISNLLREMPAGSAPEVAHLGLIGALQQTVHDELGAAFDAVTWEIAPEAGQAAEAMPALTAEVLFYAAREAIRNAARHGRAADLARPLRLRIAVEWRNGLEILIEDDGVGLGAPPAPNGGSGQGLALHGTMMAVVGGALAAESVPGRYTRVMLTLPQNAAWVA